MVVIFVTGNVAQGPPGATGGSGMGGAGMMAPGMSPGGGDPMLGGMGMGGMMGGGGGGGGGAPITYNPTDPPEHLRMTYDEYIVKEGASRVGIPEAYIIGADGEPDRRTATEWHQLGRVYREGGAVADVKRGTLGGGLADRMQAEKEHIAREHLAMNELYEYAVNNCFSATVGAPQLGVVTHEADSVDIRLNVILHSTKSFPASVAKRLTPLSKTGSSWRESSSPGGRIGATAGRARFDVITKTGGYTQPVKLYLASTAIGEWNDLWDGTQARISLMDNTGKVLAETTMSAGFDGGICEDMVFPREVFDYNTVHQLPDVSPHGTDLPLFAGGKKSMYEIKGWLIGGPGGLTFNLQAGALATLSGARVELIPSLGLTEVPLLEIQR